MRVNKLVNKIVKEEQSPSADESTIDKDSLLKLHKKLIKFVQSNIGDLRENPEVAVKEWRKLVAMESLFLNLGLLMMAPSKDEKTVLEILDDVEELKECYKNLSIGTNKKKKVDED